MRLRRQALRQTMLALGNNLRRGFVVGSALGAVVIVVSAVLFYAFERGANPGVRDVGSGFVWVTRTLLQQEPPFEPATIVGAILYYVVVIAGVGVIAMLTGAVASKLIELVMRKEAGMGEVGYRDHIVLCGWSPEGREILRELHAEEVADPIPVALVAPLEVTPTDDDLVTFVRGSPNDADVLRRAGIERARTAIVLADASNPATSADQQDAMTLLTVLAIESLNPRVHTCVEVIRSQNRPHFERAKADEVVVSAELTGSLLAFSARTHGLSKVIADLTGHRSGHEFYDMEAPADLDGKSFEEALVSLRRGIGALLVAIGGENGYEVNPGQRVVRTGDRLLVIAETDPRAPAEG